MKQVTHAVHGVAHRGVVAQVAMHEFEIEPVEMPVGLDGRTIARTA